MDNMSASGSQSSSVSELEKDSNEILQNRNDHRIPGLRRSGSRKAKRVRFYRNGDKFFSGVVIPVLPERYRSFDSLIADLTRALVDNVTLPSGVRTIYTLDGKKIEKLDELKDGQSYVCSGFGEAFKRLDYESSAVTPQSFRLSGPELQSDSPYPKAANRYPRSPGLQANGSSTGSNGIAPVSPVPVPSWQGVIRSRIVTIIRNGVKPRKVCRLLLNKRNSPTLEQALSAITECVNTGCVRKVFTQSGAPVTALHQFFQGEEVFFAYGNERVNQEDFELELEESKAVLQCRKTPISRTPRKEPIARMPVKQGGAILKAEAAGAVEDAPVSIDISLMPPALLHKYSIEDIIGDGNFAVVRICTNKTTGEKHALKIIDKLKCIGKEHYVAAEVRILRQMCHPQIITLYDEVTTRNWLFLVMELVSGGDLFDSIAASVVFSEKQSRLLISHLTSAIAYIHSLSIVHRDIKPENLLVEKAPDGTIRGLKLADFGLAVEVMEGREPLYAICGTPTYVAPEILQGKGYGLKIDVWAAGVILYIMLCGYPPFLGADQDQLFESILSGQLDFPAKQWAKVSAGAIDLVTNMLRPQPELRFAAEDVLDHAWMSDYYDTSCDSGHWQDVDSSSS